MGKVAIDFKINNTHNNTGQLLIFIYLFITSYHSLFVHGSLLSVWLFHRKSFFHWSQLILYLHYCIISLFAYFTGVSARWTCCEENLPQSIEATCASRPMQLRFGSRCWLLPCLYPVVCQAAKQGKRWDKWLFMICHLPSSQLSPGPIYYSCRLPLCGRKKCTHTNAQHCNVCTHMHSVRANKHTQSFPSLLISHSFQLKARYLWLSLPSCHLRYRTQQKWKLNLPNFRPSACCSLRSRDIIPSAALKIWCYTSHVPGFALSGTWLTSLCGICLSLHASCFSLCQTSSSWT